MKKLIVLFSLVLILATVNLSGFVFSFLQVYIVAPLLLSIFMALIKTKKPTLNFIVSWAGVLSGLLALVLYYSVNTYTGTDGQAGLIYAVMPFYQLAFMLLVAAITLLIWHFTKGSKRTTK